MSTGSPDVESAEREEDAALEPLRRRSRLRDWRVWFGVAITVVSIWWASRGIPMADVVASMREANFIPLLLLSAPFYVISVWVRALRWRHLTNPIAPMSRGALFRACSLGFMVNNILPLRIGEVVRSWTLARETGSSVGAVIGTVVLERVLDVVSVLMLALAALAFVGRTSAVGGVLEQGSNLLLPAAAAPLLGLVLLRVAPEFVIRTAHFFLLPLPLRFRELVERALRSFIGGLGALTGGSHLVWIVLHSVVIWLVLSVAPMLIGFWAFDVQIGTPMETLLRGLGPAGGGGRGGRHPPRRRASSGPISWPSRPCSSASASTPPPRSPWACWSGSPSGSRSPCRDCSSSGPPTRPSPSSPDSPSKAPPAVGR